MRANMYSRTLLSTSRKRSDKPSIYHRCSVLTTTSVRQPQGRNMALHCRQELWKLCHSWFVVSAHSRQQGHLTMHRDEALHLLLPGTLRHPAVQDAVRRVIDNRLEFHQLVLVGDA
jgi:hypothetical protein